MEVKIPFFAQRDQVVKQYLRMNYPVEGTHISVSKSVNHTSYPEGHEGCLRTHATMIGYIWSPNPKINGTDMTLIYINDLKGSLPVKLVRIMANKMQRKATSDMYKGMVMFMNN